MEGIEQAVKTAEGIADQARQLYEEFYKGEEVTVAPQAFVFQLKGDELNMIGFEPSIMARAWSDHESRHAFAQMLANLVQIGVAQYAIVVSESYRTQLNPEQAKRMESEDAHSLKDRSIAVGAKPEECIYVTLYLPGPRTMFGFASIEAGKAQPFQWQQQLGRVEGGMVAGYEQQATN